MPLIERESGDRDALSNSLRSMLIESQVAAVALLLLTLWAFGNFLSGLAQPALHILVYLGTAIAIFDIPAGPSPSEVRMVALYSTGYLASALGQFCAAWILSKTVYGVGPISALREIRIRLKGAGNA